MLTIVNHYTISLISRVMLYTVLLFACLQNTYTQECPQGRVTISSQTQLDSFVLTIQDCDSLDHIIIGNVDTIYGFDHIKKINRLSLNGSNFKVLQGFNNLIEAGEIRINNQHQTLRRIDGFRRLEKVGFLGIYANYNLSSISGFDSLKTVRRLLFQHFIGDSLDAFRSLQEIEHDFELSHTKLKTLKGLNNLRKMGRPYTNINTRSYDFWLADNDLLSDISALDSLEITQSITGHFVLARNYLLSTCNTHMICNFLANRKGQVFISNNAPGCQSIQQVEQACITHTKDEPLEQDIILYPNPAQDKLCIRLPAGLGLKAVDLIHLSSGNIFFPTFNDYCADISNLRSGIYTVKITLSDQSVKYKRVVVFK